MSIKILQLNLGRGRAAHYLAFLTLDEEEVDVLVVAEPNKKIVSGTRWLADSRRDVGIYFRNKKVGVVEHMCGDGYVMCGDGYVYVEFEDFRMMVCYIFPNLPREEYETRVDEIMEVIRAREGPTMVLGDLNAKSAKWSDGIQDARGEYLGDWISTMDMLVVNLRGCPPSSEEAVSRP